MDEIINVKNLNYKYHANDYIFENLTFSLKRGSFTTLVGPNGSGKSTLIKILLGFLKTESEIHINGLELCPRNINLIRSKIGVVFEDPNEIFVAETVMDEIAFVLENKNMSKQEIWKKVTEIATILGIEEILEKDPHSLSGGEKVLVSFASILVMEPSIIILDEALTSVDEMEKKKIFNILKELNEKEKITILNITHDLNECLYGEDIILLNNGNIILSGPKEEILAQEQTFKKAGLELPFLADLSIRLMYYGVLDHMILDIDEMVNAIWK